MLHVEVNEQASLAILTPQGTLSEADFAAARRIIDPLIAQAGGLKGIIIHAERFPGWDSLSAMMSHLQFVHDHHRKLDKVAIATDSPIGSALQGLAQHFIAAQVRSFAYDELAQAKAWISGPA